MVLIEVNDYRSQLNGVTTKLIKILRRYLRQENDFWARKHNPRMPKYKYFVTKKGSFLTGFLPRVVTLMKRAGVEYKIEDKRRIRKMPDMGVAKLHLDDMEIGGNPLKLRDYQLESLVRGYKKTRGIFDLATGAGKTVIMAALVKTWRKKTLVVINSKDLARQLRGELEEYMDEPVGFIGDGLWQPEQFTVAIDKTLTSSKGKKKRARIKKYLESVEYLIFDEVHHLQSNTWRSISKSCKNASLRHGFSGTPETSTIKRSDGTEGNRDGLLEGYLGPTIHEISTKWLIDAGWLARPLIKVVRNDVYFDSNPLTYNKEYDRIIVGDEFRNRAICELTLSEFKDNGQTIGFVTRIEHGERLMDMMATDFGIPKDGMAFAHGSSYSRDEDIEAFKQGDLPILFGTVLSEGLNFHCDLGIKAGAGKSGIQTKQEIGRILRKEKMANGEVNTDREETVTFVDFQDNGHPWFAKHARRRIRTYKAEGHELEYVDVDDLLK